MILFPGLTAANLEVKVDDDADKSLLCWRTTQGKWVPFWPPPQNATLADTGCLVADIQLEYDSASNTFMSKRKGVHIRVTDFGGFSGMKLFAQLLPVFKPLGYVDGKNFFGAPFDWRLIPSNSLNDFYNNLTQLVEHAYNINNQTKVNFLAPSFGPQMVLSYLQKMDQAWKDKYIDWFICDSPVWAGSYTALIATVMGQASPKPANLTNRLLLRVEALGIPATMWLFPHRGSDDTTFAKQDVLMATKSKNYTAFDYLELFKDLGIKGFDSFLEYASSEPTLTQFDAPGVKTFISFGYGVPTPGPLTFDTDFHPLEMPSQPTNFQFINGDSIVPVRSSVRGGSWIKSQSHPVIHKSYLQQQHAACLVPVPRTAPYCCCFQDFLGLMINGTMPQGAMTTEAELQTFLHEQGSAHPPIRHKEKLQVAKNLGLKM